MAGWRDAGCGMRVKLKVGHGMTELLMARCGIEIFRWDWGLLFLIDGMRDSLKLTAGCGMKNRKSPHYRRYADRELRSKLAGSAYKHSEWSGMAGLTRTEVTAGCGIENAYTGPSRRVLACFSEKLG